MSTFSSSASHSPTGVLVTGASGFVGSALLETLAKSSVSQPVGVYRSAPGHAGKFPTVHIEGIDEDTDWTHALKGISVIVHAAARVHVMSDTAQDPLAEFRRVNVQGTLNLARQAISAGVSRFIFVSSIKVNGEETFPGRPFTYNDPAAPQDPYGISKAEAEIALTQLAAEHGLELVIIRPTLVYGPGVKANYRNMMKWLLKGVPLPLGSIRNKRSLVSVYNLVDLISVCIHHPKAPGQTFLVSDHHDLSTTQLLNKVGKALGRRPWLIPVPMALIYGMAAALGKKAFAQRLCGSLQVDISHTVQRLDWHPPVSVEEAIRLTADDFKEGVK